LLLTAQMSASKPRYSDEPSSGARARRLRALVIEDVADFRELLVSELELAGFSVAEAADGEEGLAEVRSFEPDVVVLDLMLPRLNGFSLARVVRAFERERKIAILAVSALTSEPLRNMALNAGCDSFLGKPVTTNEVIEEVRRLLRRGVAAYHRS
jgi:DNA-binding response OmpR family regulator